MNEKSEHTKSKHSDCCSDARLDLTEKEAVQKLAYLDQWVLMEDKGQRKLAKFYAVNDFQTGVMFVNAIEAITHKFNHHPTIQISYKEVGIFWRTYSAKGVTDLDFASAEACDVLFQDLIAANTQISKS